MISVAGWFCSLTWNESGVRYLMLCIDSKRSGSEPISNLDSVLRKTSPLHGRQWQATTCSPYLQTKVINLPPGGTLKRKMVIRLHKKIAYYENNWPNSGVRYDRGIVTEHCSKRHKNMPTH